MRACHYFVFVVNCMTSTAHKHVIILSLLSACGMSNSLYLVCLVNCVAQHISMSFGEGGDGECLINMCDIYNTQACCFFVCLSCLLGNIDNM